MPDAGSLAAIMKIARDEAIRLGHLYVGPEHQLLGLLRYEDPAVLGLLAGAGTDAEEIRSALERTLPAGEADEIPPNWELPYTARAKRVLTPFMLLFQSGTGHAPTPMDLLRSILEEEKNVAAIVLRQHGVDHIPG